MPNSRDIPLEHGNYYHIYNRGNNGETLFHSPKNYRHFISLYDKYIPLIADTYAWCLMGNHFHLLVRIKEVEEINNPTPPHPVRVENPDRAISPKPPHIYFSHLFNSYTQAINKQQGRTGSLFERPFHRIRIDTEQYFQNLVLYIHQNPAHHQFTDDFREYPWSSYQSIISVKPTKVDRKTVLEWFDGKENFIETHQRIVDPSIIDGLI